MSQKANRLPSARDRLLKNKKEIKELYGLSRQRITQRTIQPPSGGTGSPRGDTAPSGNFLKTEGDRMIGPIAFDPVLVSIVDNVGMDDDNSINISRNTGANPPDYSSYVLVSPSGLDDELKTIFGAAFNGQLLYLQGTATTIIRLQNGDATNGGNIVTPDGSEFAISGAKIVTLIFDPTISPSAGVQGAWRIMDNRGSAISDVFHATADANYAPVTNEHVEFNESVDGVETGIAVSTGVAQAQGIFSNLLAGRSYLLEAGLEVEFDGNTGDLEYQWFDVTGAVLIGTKGIAWNIRDSSQVGSQPIATAIFSPSADSQVEVRITGDVNADAVLLASSPNTKSSFARITELGGGGGGTGTGGGGINFPILYPIDVIGTAPVSPSTTDIDLAATTAHVHTLDTVGDVTINFINPPVGLFNITGELIITTNGSGSIVTFSQTTQPTSSFTLEPNSRNIITFQSSDNGSTYDVFQAGQAGGGGGATALNDLTDVNLAGVTINDIFQFNGVFWINKQSFNFGAGPFGMTGFQRYTNNDIMFSARNAADNGDLELKTTLTNTLDYTDSGESAVAIQARTQHATEPDNRISISVGSGIGAEAALATNTLVLGFEVAAFTRLKLETFAGGEILTLKTEASGVTNLATFVITSTHITDPDNTLAFSVLTGAFGAAIIGTVPVLKFRNDGHDTLRIDGSIENVVLTLETDAVATTSVSSINLISKHVSDPDNSLVFAVGSGAGAEAIIGTSVSILGFDLGGTTRLKLETFAGGQILTLKAEASGATILSTFDIVSVHVSDPDNSMAFSVTSGVAGEAIIGTTVEKLQFRNDGHDSLSIDGASENILVELATDAVATTSTATLNLISKHVTDPDNSLALSVIPGAAGVAIIGTNVDELRIRTGGNDTFTVDTNLFAEATIDAPATHFAGILNILARHATDPVNETQLSTSASATGITILSSSTDEIQLIVDLFGLGALNPIFSLREFGGTDRALELRQDSIGIDNLSLILENIPSTMVTGTLAQIDYKAEDDSGNDQVYARIRGAANNIADGNEDGSLFLEVAINGVVSNVLQVGGASSTGELGFFNSGVSGQQNVTGSRGGNAALASLLTALASYGLITDSTTA